MFYQIFLSPQVKRRAIITYQHGIYEYPYELLNDLILTILGNKKQKKILAESRFDNILKLCDSLPNFPFTTSETMRDYYLWTWYTRVAPRTAEPLNT